MTSHPGEDAVELHIDGGYELAEGPRWVDGRLVFVDILTGRLFEVVAGRPRLLAQLAVPLGAVAPVAGRPGSWIAAAGTGIAILEAGREPWWLDQPEAHNPTATRMNDGCCDPTGRFWAGSMPFDGTPGAGSLYRVDRDHTVHRVMDGLTIVNGPAFSADGRWCYVADSAAAEIYRCRLDPGSGSLGRRDIFTRLDSDTGSPDGMTVDDDGHLWVAIWGGSAVHRYRPDGTLAHVVRLPAPQPTAPCLPPAGGRLLVTTARYGLADPGRASGAILSLPAPIGAPPAAAYRG